MRRGPERGTNAASRASLVGGADFTSNVGLSHAVGFPPKGTHAHSMLGVRGAGEGELGAFLRPSTPTIASCWWTPSTPSNQACPTPSVFRNAGKGPRAGRHPARLRRPRSPGGAVGEDARRSGLHRPEDRALLRPGRDHDLPDPQPDRHRGAPLRSRPRFGDPAPGLRGGDQARHQRGRPQPRRRLQAGRHRRRGRVAARHQAVRHPRQDRQPGPQGSPPHLRLPRLRHRRRGRPGRRAARTPVAPLPSDRRRGGASSVRGRRLGQRATVREGRPWSPVDEREAIEAAWSGGSPTSSASTSASGVSSTPTSITSR